MPTALSDHGVQMARKSAKQFFKDLGIKQLFARYKTPTDMPGLSHGFLFSNTTGLGIKIM